MDSPDLDLTFPAYLGRRLVTAVLTLLGVAVVVFLMIRLLPGDPAEVMLARSGASREAVEQLRTELGLDSSLAEQFLAWCSSVVRGNLGHSLFSSRPVADLIVEQAPYTAVLAAAAFGWAVCIGLALGMVSAKKPGTWLDRCASLLVVGGISVPVFWSGLILIWLFSVRLGWLPSAGADSGRALIMPSLVLGYASAGSIARITRAGLLEVLAQPYITAAHAKGLTHRRVLLRHAAPNAAIPVLTISGVQLGFLLGGTVVTETLFSRPGLGRLLIDAILWRDLPVVQGVVLVTAGTYVAVNLAVDLLAGWISPQRGWQ